MSAIIPLTSGAKLPAYLAKREKFSAINADVIHGGPSFGVLSIKGKVFTLVKGGEKRVLTRPDDPDEVLQNVNMTVVRANTKARVFYAKAYVEGAEGDAARPDCYSPDGVAPAADARNPQAKKCQLCPHAVWGGGADGKGTACSVNTRLAVLDPTSAELEPYLLRLPAGSRRNFADVVKAAETRGIPYNALVLKIGFDKEAPAPKLTFKLMGLLDDATYEKVNALYESEPVLEIVDLAPKEAHEPEGDTQAAPAVTEDELDAALAAKQAAKEKADAEKAAKEAAAAKAAADKAARDAQEKVESDSKAAAKAARAVTEKATKAAAKSPEVEIKAPDDMDALLNELDGLLGSTDD